MISWWASRVRVLADDQEMGAAMVMSPRPALVTPGPLAPPAVVCRVTLVVARLALMVFAAAVSTVRSVGSTSQLRAVIFTPVKLTEAPDVSTSPPSAPPEAVTVPLAVTPPWSEIR